MVIEITFWDLTEEKQKELLKAYKVREPEEMNWDICPIAVLELEADEGEEEEYDEDCDMV